MAVVAKALGEKWRALSDEQKAEYKARASERAAANPNTAQPAAGRAPVGRSVQPCSDAGGRPGDSTQAAAGDSGDGDEALCAAGCALAAGSSGAEAEAMVGAVAEAVARAIAGGGALADAEEVARVCAGPEPDQAAAAGCTGGEAHADDGDALHEGSAAAEAGAAAAAAPPGADAPGDAGAAGEANAMPQVAMAVDTAEGLSTVVRAAFDAGAADDLGAVREAGTAAHAAMAADTAGDAAADACAVDGAGTAAEATGAGEPGAPGAAGVAAGEQGPGANPVSHPFGFPLGLVKRIMDLDPDVKRVSGEGLRAMAKATELLLELLTGKAAEQVGSSQCLWRTYRLGLCLEGYPSRGGRCGGP